MTENGQTNGRTAGPLPGRDVEKLNDVLAEWVLLFPTVEDAAAVALSDTLRLNCESYTWAERARYMWGRRLIVVSGDSEAHQAEASAVVTVCKSRKAELARLWPLPEFLTVFPTMAAWLAAYRLELVLQMETPWKGADEAGPEKLQETQGDAVLRHSQGIALFRATDGTAYGSFTVGGKVEHHPIKSEPMREYLLEQYWLEFKRAPSNEAIESAVRMLAARARFEGSSAEVSIRVGADPAAVPGNRVIYLDLGDVERRAVRVDITGWDVVAGALPVKFRRPAGMGALPVPARGADVGELWRFVNVATNNERLLVLGALTSYFRPWGPYPVAIVTGEQGSAKSTTCRVLRRCVDPREPLLSAAPKELRDLMVSAKNSWVLTYDNLSSLPVWLSDGLARLATGGGFSTRKNYSDDEEQLFQATRPIVINSIEEIAARADLLDRGVILNCPVIPDTERREEERFWRDFEGAYPRILGALLDLVAGGLAMLPLVKLKASPRMADFARWGEAVCRSLGFPEGDFLAAYTSNRDNAIAAVLEESPVAAELLEFRGPGEEWVGSCKELLECLRMRAEPASLNAPRWPRSPRGLSGQLRRIAPALRRVGVDVHLDVHARTKHARPVRIVWTAVGGSPPYQGIEPSPPSSLSPDGANGLPGGNTQSLF